MIRVIVFPTLFRRYTGREERVGQHLHGVVLSPEDLDAVAPEDAVEVVLQPLLDM
jgi:hypothetical protein